MQIRALNPGDAIAYRELRLRSLREHPEAFLTTYEMEKEKPIEMTEQNLDATDSKFTLGAFDHHELVGMVTFVRENRPKITHKGNLYAMYVSPELRGHGIGKALIDELLERARTCSGLEQINLTVISDNVAAKRLYESSGFVVYGTERNGMKSGEQYWDENLMVKML